MWSRAIGQDCCFEEIARGTCNPDNNPDNNPVSNTEETCTVLNESLTGSGHSKGIQ